VDRDEASSGRILPTGTAGVLPACTHWQGASDRRLYAGEIFAGERAVPGSSPGPQPPRLSLTAGFWPPQGLSNRTAPADMTRKRDACGPGTPHHVRCQIMGAASGRRRRSQAAALYFAN
jgi:hypothetical protein